MSGVRRLPLKIAGVIGIFTAAFYVAVLLGATGPVGALEIGWVVLMFVAGVLAWTAPDTPVHARRVAMAAAVLFFITGVGLKLLDHSGELLVGF